MQQHFIIADMLAGGLGLSMLAVTMIKAMHYLNELSMIAEVRAPKPGPPLAPEAVTVTQQAIDPAKTEAAGNQHNSIAEQRCQ